MSNLPIGVFDSGVGGLTVLKTLQAILPHESFIYLGDTARLPYGTKSPETVQRYASQASDLIFQTQAIKMLVIACNTASTLAYETLAKKHPDIPVIDVVRPGAEAAVNSTQNGDIAVIATEATVAAGGYQKAIHALKADAQVIAETASVFVALAEEGWVDNNVAISAAEQYLTPLLNTHEDFEPDTLLLGCTHFPALLPAIEMVIPEHIVIVDSATATAMAVAQTLNEKRLGAKQSEGASTRFLVTDCPERFARVASRFLGVALLADQVEIVSL